MVKTRLSPLLTTEQAAELYSCMLRDTLAKAAGLAGSLALFLFYEPRGSAAYFQEIAEGMELLPQKGSNLGERMEQAFGQVFSLGYRAAAIIGTDSPHLPPACLMESFLRLEQGADVVFGPAADGGYYLLAMKGSNPELFRGIEYSNSAVLRESLEKAAAENLAVSLLPEWHDVDTAEDLNRPELLDENNGAELTRRFILQLRAGSRFPSFTTL